MNGSFFDIGGKPPSTPKKPKPKAEGKWTCAGCATVNGAARQVCRKCEIARPAEDEPAVHGEEATVEIVDIKDRICGLLHSDHMIAAGNIEAIEQGTLPHDAVCTLPLHHTGEHVFTALEPEPRPIALLRRDIGLIAWFEAYVWRVYTLKLIGIGVALLLFLLVALTWYLAVAEGFTVGPIAIATITTTCVGVLFAYGISAFL